MLNTYHNYIKIEWKRKTIGPFLRPLLQLEIFAKLLEFREPEKKKKKSKRHENILNNTGGVRDVNKKIKERFSSSHKAHKSLGLFTTLLFQFVSDTHKLK